MPKRRSARRRTCAASGRQRAHGIEHDEVVAQAVHLGEGELHGCSCRRCIALAGARTPPGDGRSPPRPPGREARLRATGPRPPGARRRRTASCGSRCAGPPGPRRHRSPPGPRPSRRRPGASGPSPGPGRRAWPPGGWSATGPAGRAGGAAGCWRGPGRRRRRPGARVGRHSHSSRQRGGQTREPVQGGLGVGQHGGGAVEGVAGRLGVGAQEAQQDDVRRGRSPGPVRGRRRRVPGACPASSSMKQAVGLGEVGLGIGQGLLGLVHQFGFRAAFHGRVDSPANSSAMVSRRRTRWACVAVHHDLRRPRPAVVVGAHGEAIGPAAAHGQQVARAPGPAVAVLAEEVPGLADRAHQVVAGGAAPRSSVCTGTMSWRAW